MREILRKMGGSSKCGVRLVDLDIELREGSREKLWASVKKGEITYSRMINDPVGFFINENYEENDNDNTPHEH